MNPPSFGDITPPKQNSETGTRPISTNERISSPDAKVQSSDTSDLLESSIIPSMKLSTQLESLEREYQSEVNFIRRETEVEKSAIIERLESEKQVLLADLYAQEDLNLMKAKDAFDKKRERVLSGVASTQSCAYCHTDHKYLSALCIECKVIAICEQCLNEHINEECKCSNCSAVTSIICTSCQKKKLREIGWFEFDPCRGGCGFLCPEHSTVLMCQSCGYQSFCNGPKRHCQLHQCSKCNIIICTTCRKTDGCICSSAFNVFDDSGWRPVASSTTITHASRFPDAVDEGSPDNDSYKSL